jgi:hypothetical protein
LKLLKLQPQKNREYGFSLGRSWKHLIHTLKEWNNVLRRRHILLLDLTLLSACPGKGCLFYLSKFKTELQKCTYQLHSVCLPI